MNSFVLVYLVFFGLLFGSFANAAAWRVWLRLQESEKKEKKKREISSRRKVLPSSGTQSLLTGRSMCPECKHQLAAKDLVPVLSWLALRGRCRYCSDPISWQYPAVELATAVLFGLSYLLWDFSEPLAILGFIVWLITLVGYMILVVIDVRWQLLPFVVTLPLIGLYVLYLALYSIMSGELPLSELTGVIALGGLFSALHFGSRGKWLGFGDVPLIVVMALHLGAVGGLMALFIGSLIGSLWALTTIALKKRRWSEQIPFGPLLIIGAIIVELLGESVIDNYLVLIN